MNVFLIACFIVSFSCTVTSDDEILRADIRRLIGNTGRIINGETARLGQFPWQTAVVSFASSETASLCGGALIATRWVLTAAHCVNNAISSRVLFGIIDLSKEEPGVQQGTSAALIMHPQFNRNTLRNDIALIVLKEPVHLNNNVKVIDLPSADDYVPAHTKVTVSGWGRTSSASSENSVLKYVSLATISNAVCQEEYGGDEIFEMTVCCRGASIESTCFGDSGGPVIREGASGQFVHVGVISFVYSEVCESGKPSGHVRTATYRRWIDEEMKNYRDAPSHATVVGGSLPAVALALAWNSLTRPY